MIEGMAKNNRLSRPFLVGGIVRDRLLGRTADIQDVDMTTGDTGSLVLPHIFANSISGASIKMMPDQHSQVIFEGIKYDFSSNYRSPQLEAILNKAGLTQPSEIQKEAYSRDFTCNTLLLDFQFKNLVDPTGMGKRDAKNKILRTCLPAGVTLSDQLKRVPRVFYLAAKLGFSVDEEIINWIKMNPKLIATLTADDWSKKLTKALQYNQNIVVDLLTRCDVWHALPYIPALSNIQVHHP